MSGHSQVCAEVHEAHDVIPLQLSPHKILGFVQGTVQGEVRPLGAKQQPRFICAVVLAIPVSTTQHC